MATKTYCQDLENGNELSVSKGENCNQKDLFQIDINKSFPAGWVQWIIDEIMKVANTKAKIDDKLSDVKVSIDSEGWIRIKWIYNGHDDAGTCKPLTDDVENEPAAEESSSKDEDNNNQEQPSGGDEQVSYASNTALLFFLRNKKTKLAMGI